MNAICNFIQRLLHYLNLHYMPPERVGHESEPAQVFIHCHFCGARVEVHDFEFKTVKKSAQ